MAKKAKKAKKKPAVMARMMKPQRMWAAVIDKSGSDSFVMFADRVNAVAYSHQAIDALVNDPTFAQFNPRRARVELREVRR